jgi:hypothetical protein
VRLGDRWVDDPVELFDDLVRLFPPLFPTLDAEDPDAALDAGCAPGLRELRLHNGTVWHWNRPVYDVQAGRPQLRIENRLLPSGPTAVDMVANAAFYYGLLRAIADSDSAPWRRCRSQPSGTCTARHATGWRRGCAGGASTTRPISTHEVLLPAAAAGLAPGAMRTTATGTSVSSKRVDAVAPALPADPERCATEEHGLSGSQRCVR